MKLPRFFKEDLGIFQAFFFRNCHIQLIGSSGSHLAKSSHDESALLEPHENIEKQKKTEVKGYKRQYLFNRITFIIFVIRQKQLNIQTSKPPFAKELPQHPIAKPKKVPWHKIPTNLPFSKVRKITHNIKSISSCILSNCNNM